FGTTGVNLYGKERAILASMNRFEMRASGYCRAKLTFERIESRRIAQLAHVHPEQFFTRITISINRSLIYLYNLTIGLNHPNDVARVFGKVPVARKSLGGALSLAYILKDDDEAGCLAVLT